jgi:AcrR family transcriptional regulator
MTAPAWFANPPRQQRTRLAADRVLAAAEGLLARGGDEELTIQAVAAEAQVSVGGIYRLFHDKAALVRAVHDRVMARMEDELVNALRSSEPTVSATATTLVSAVTTAMRRRAPALRVFLGQGAGDPALRDRALRGVRRVNAALAEALARDRDGLAHDDPAQAAQFLLEMVLGTTMRAVGLAGAGASGANRRWDAFVSQLDRAAQVYLTAPAPVPERVATRGARPGRRRS